MKHSTFVILLGLIIAVVNIIFSKPLSNGYYFGIIIMLIGWVIKKLEDLEDNK